MRKTLGLAALVAATTGVLLPASPASAGPLCDVVREVAATYEYLDAKAGGRLPEIVWYCQD